jgi:hypothetical protein
LSQTVPASGEEWHVSKPRSIIELAKPVILGRGMPVNPTLQALWLVEDVTTDESTGKVTVVGLFNQIVLPSGATEYDQPSTIFFSVSGVHGLAMMKLCFVDLTTLEVLRERPVRVDATDPLEVTDLVVRVNEMPVPHDGVYAWELYCDGEMLGSSRLTFRLDS